MMTKVIGTVNYSSFYYSSVAIAAIKVTFSFRYSSEVSMYY